MSCDSVSNLLRIIKWESRKILIVLNFGGQKKEKVNETASSGLLINQTPIGMNIKHLSQETKPVNHKKFPNGFFFL